MTYSVWDPISGTYQYYQTPQDGKLEHDVPKARHLSTSSKVGITPEQAAWPLPANAKRIGTGKTAKGMIAQKPGGLAMGDTLIGGIGVGTFAIVGVLLYFAFRR
jgi:hypothetical protein